MQKEILNPTPLHNNDGELQNSGWARQPFWRYDREQVAGPKWRIKEWDYYAVISQQQKIGITFTYSDLGFAGLYAICWLDFNSGTFKQIDCIKPLTRHRTGLKEHPGKQSLHVNNSDMKLSIDSNGDSTHIAFRLNNCEIGKGQQLLSGTLELQQGSHDETLNIATSWSEDRSAFYYNQKANNLRVTSGSLVTTNNEFNFDQESTLACLDWGRGRWTRNNTWYWASLSAQINNRRVGFNLGYGFSDRSVATENAIIVDGKIHKLDQVTFEFNNDNYLEQWRITDNEGRLDLVMKPQIDRASSVNLLIIRSEQHQVFGELFGTLVLDSGEEISLDGQIGFAEKVFNLW